MNLDEIQVRISESSDNSSHLPVLARNAPVTPSLGKNILSPEDLSEMRKNNDIGEFNLKDTKTIGKLVNINDDAYVFICRWKQDIQI